MKRQQVNGNASRELTFRSQMADLRARKSLYAEEIQELADALSRLWRERNHLYTNRLARAAKMLQGMIDVDAVEVASTGDATTPETEATEKGEKKIPPSPPIRKGPKRNPHHRVCARV